MDEQKDKLDLEIKQVSAKIKNMSPKPDVCPSEEQLAAYLEGGLVQDEIDSIEEHMAVCDDCIENILSLSEKKSSGLFVKGEPVPKDMILKAKSHMKPQKMPTLMERMTDWFADFKLMPAMATVSVALIVLAIGIFMVQSPDDPLKDAPLSVKLDVMARVPTGMPTRGSDIKYKIVEVGKGDSLKTGDSFKIKYQVKEEAYVYLLSLDSQGNISKIFPEKDTIQPVKIEPNKVYTFPHHDKWFVLDDNTGKETLYLIASRKPIEDVNKRIGELKMSGIDKIETVFSGISIQSFVFKHE